MNPELPEAEALNRELAQAMNLEMHYGIGMIVCFLTTVDSCYFIIYAAILSSRDSLLMVRIHCSFMLNASFSKW